MRTKLGLVVAFGLGATSCGIGGDGVTVSGPTVVAEDAGDDVEVEVIEGPGFRLELEPGEDPDEALELALRDDAGGEPVARPADALVSLCPAIERLVTGAAGDDPVDELATLVNDTPARWSDLIALAANPVGQPSSTELRALDAYYYDTCSVPLFSGATQLAHGCAAPGCRQARVEDELGGLCFDEVTSGDGARSFVLLDCNSGLAPPAAGGDPG